jgi:hypothetical protein
VTETERLGHLQAVAEAARELLKTFDVYPGLGTQEHRTSLEVLRAALYAADAPALNADDLALECEIEASGRYSVPRSATYDCGEPGCCRPFDSERRPPQATAAVDSGSIPDQSYQTDTSAKEGT